MSWQSAFFFIDHFATLVKTVSHQLYQKVWRLAYQTNLIYCYNVLLTIILKKYYSSAGRDFSMMIYCYRSLFDILLSCITHNHLEKYFPSASRHFCKSGYNCWKHSCELYVDTVFIEDVAASSNLDPFFTGCRLKTHS